MKEIKLPFEQVTVFFSIHWSYLMFVIGTTGIARTKKSVMYKMQNSICFTFSGVFLVFGDVFNSFFFRVSSGIQKTCLCQVLGILGVEDR